MEQIVNWFMLLIIFVFDPLAIAMVVAANMAFAQIKSTKLEPKEIKKDYKVFKKDEVIEEKVPTIKSEPELEPPMNENKYVSPWGKPGGSRKHN